MRNGKYRFGYRTVWFRHNVAHRIVGPAYIENDRVIYYYYGCLHNAHYLAIANSPHTIFKGEIDKYYYYGTKLRANDFFDYGIRRSVKYDYYMRKVQI